MHRRLWIWILAGLLCLAGVWLLWRQPVNTRTKPSALPQVAATTARSASAVSKMLIPAYTNSPKAGTVFAGTNKFAFRLENTRKTIGQLTGDRHAILLENALIDTGSPLTFSIPAHLRSQGDPGAYIVQARGPIDNTFRALLASAGAQIVSYIPNDAYLVRAQAGVANGLAENSLVQAVTSYEPYYKIQSSLLLPAIGQMNLPDGAALNLGLFADSAPQTIQEIEKLGGTILAQDRSPFGPVIRVRPPRNWTMLATLPGVQIVEGYHPRVHANDLSRVATGVSGDTLTTSNYLNLSGSNVIVEVNDSGIDATHPDFMTGGAAPLRVFGDPSNLVDINGHGTHVAGIIGGDGYESTTVTNVPGSIIATMPGPTATNYQFRGKAPLAKLLAMDWGRSDQELQAVAALTNALISNNSWNNGDPAYDLEAASYDAAVRDSLPLVTGSQPVTYVFSAGNDGGGDDSSDPGGGIADTILSPATAKNVITVGAIQEFRYITNQVTTISADGTTTNFSTPWQLETSTSYRVAGFSARGNVGIGTEGTYGRYKPDVVAPGTFVVSTRSSQWDITDYFFMNPTNHNFHTDTNIVAQPGSVWANVFPIVPNNAVGVSIWVSPNPRSPVPFPILAIYAGLYTSPGYDFVTANNPLVVPGDPNAAAAGFDLPSILNTEGYWGFNYAVSNSTVQPISFNVVTDVITTNNPGDYFLVLSNLNQAIGTPNPSSTGPGPYYRYETGTSMSAADVSGVLALIGDYFTNTLQRTPSPALLKAMLINGARPTGFYKFQVQNSINYEGWGLVNLSDSLPTGITTNLSSGVSGSMYILDQSPTNALATGDSHTYLVTLVTNLATVLPLRITLAWTDPPGDPAAAIKLVNDLNLVVTNLSNPTNVIVYYGNDIPASSVYNAPENSTNAPVFDFINNVENVYLPPSAGTNFSITVLGYRVNVNAVTAQTNNVVQDYALVISSGEGELPNALTVTDGGSVSAPTSDQQITFVLTTNQPLLNQIVGASSPLLGTNTLPVGTNTIWGSNGVVTLGMTNQWHFYVVTNTGSGADFTNAAFITFLPSTLAIPRMGGFADSTADATRPEADIDLYVSMDPTLTNLNPTVISDCLAGVNGGAASLSRGGTEFVVYTNSVSIAASPSAPSVYYVGVYSEDREAAEYDFIPIFTDIPFSQPGPNGSQIVNGLNVPVEIPDGSPAHPGHGYVFAIALYPMEINRVVVTNMIEHQNFGDLIGTLRHGNTSGASQSIVLNNHDSLFNPPGIYTHIYDDSGRGDIVGSQPSDGPGSLNSFVGQQGVGVWMLTEVDDSLTQTGRVTGFNMLIEPHQDLTGGITVTLEPNTWYYGYIDVPAGYTNLSIFATNLPPTSVPPLQLYLNYNVQPDFSNYLDFVLLTNCASGTYPTGVDPGNSISYGPPLLPGRYFVGLYNPDSVPHDAYLLAALGGFASAIPPTDYSTTNIGPVLLDDAVGSSTIFVSSAQQIASLDVGFVVKHPRISDLTFTLVSPTGQRILLMENRGGDTTNGAGNFFVTTNSFASVTANGNGLPQTNYLNVGQTSGSLTINYDMYQVPDQMTVYYGTDSANFTPANALFNSGLVSYTGTITVNFGPGNSTYVTVIMNQFGNPAGPNGTAWIYTAGGVQTNYNYLTFTENTNVTTTPIKFAIPPFILDDYGTNYVLSDFELATNGDYLAPTNIFDDRGGWTLTNLVMVGTNLVSLTNQVSVVTDPANASGGSNFLALANGMISRLVPMTPGRQFNLAFMYRGPGISAWWRGEGNATDSSDPENNGNNGSLIGRFNFPAGEVGQAFQFEDAGAEFQFAGTNTYVQIRQQPFLIWANTNGGSDTNLFLVPATSLDVGAGSGFTVEGWINPTNASLPQPLVEWLARVPTNGSDTNLVIEAGPFLNRDTGHYYYLLGGTNWTTSELWATQLGGHLVTVNTANEQNWVYDTFARYGGTNRNLWIGLTNDPANPANFAWSSGQTNVFYSNWMAGEPTNCSGSDIYTAILGPTNAYPGLWVLENNTGTNNNGLTCNVPPTNWIYGVVEVEDIQTNGVQFWISVTNSPGMTNLLVSSNGCLYANLVDITNGSHEIFSAPGLIQGNVYQHVALTYSTNSGLAALYYNGTNVATTNLGVFVPKTTGDVLLGRDMSRLTNNFYGGKMDEMSIYSRCLSASEIAAIYNVSALTTNRNTGKFDPSITPAFGLAEARVSLGGRTNIILGMNKNWQMQSLTFAATTNSLPLQITGIEPGMLLDSFSVAEAPLGNLYYFPEQSLESLTDTSAHGTWTLEVWDNRAGAFITNGDQLISWQLQIVLKTNSLPVVALDPDTATTITVPPGQIVYLTVAAPIWAASANNVLVSATAPVDLLFNQTNPPTGSNPNDFTFLTNSTSGSYMMTTAPVPPPQLLPGQTYYLGVRNSGPHAVTAVVEVDFNLIVLTNGVPLSDVLTTNFTDVERYYAFDVTSNAYEATFQLLNLSGNADLVIRKGAPLPTLTSSDYGSFNTANVDENIYVFTNSSPVPLSAGRWYLGVFPRDPRPIQYTILAKELDLDASTPAIIDLTNNVPFSFTAGPGAALTNFFRFTVTNSPPSIRFELYDLSGNGDLTVQTNAPPFGPPFFQTSQQPGRGSEFIFIATNSALNSPTNSALTNLNAQWYLGVPNRETNLISYTIVAALGTNDYFPAFPGAGGAGGGAMGGGSLRNGTNGTVYHVYNLDDSGLGSLRDAVSATNRTVVFDVSGTIGLLSPLVITNSYLTIAGQTAPGGGITVAGQMTTVQSAHDVVIRDLRFRSGGGAWSSGFESAAAGDYVSGVNPAFDTWTAISNQVTVISNAALAYSGAKLLALADGVISNTLPTVPGQTYTQSFAYRGPSIVSMWRGENNGSDSIGNNPGIPSNVTYASGEVGTAFVFNGTSSQVRVPASASLNVGINNSGYTIDAWVNPVGTTINNLQSLLEWNVGSGSGAAPIGAQFGISGGFDGDLYANIMDTTLTAHYLSSAAGIMVGNTFQHVAVTFDKTTGLAVLYRNGVVVQSANLGTGFTPWTSINFYIGCRPAGSFANHFQGIIDEPSLYNRALSASEIKAIYNHGSAGKYNTNAPTIALGLAEAQVSIGGSSWPVFFGNNTNWQTTNITFTATRTNTPLRIAGIEPGMLLDAVSLTPSVNPYDSLQFTNVMNVIADHVSASWTSNNLVSVLGSTNVTVQWSILADSLYDTNNPRGFGSLLRYGGGALSFHHNLYADNYSGNPRLGDNLSLDFVNNVIYNWGIFPGYSTNDIADNPPGFTNQLNYACNYLIAGPDSVMTNFAIAGTNLVMTNVAFWGGSTNTWIFQTNNFIDSDTNRILNGANTDWGMFTNLYTRFSRPFQLPQVPTDEAFLAYEKVLDFAGPAMTQRDPVDTNIVAKVRSQSGRLISAAGTLPLLNSPPPPLDSDQDGIPDYWEITLGTDPFVASNNNDRDGDGYTDLEEYINWLAAPHALTVTNAPVGVDLYRLAGDTGNLSFFVTNAVNGTVYLTNVLGSVTNTGPFSNSFAIFTPAPNYSGYASFGFFVTNNDTVAWFGPVPVSVMVSAVPVIYGGIITLTNQVPYNDPTGPNGVDYYRYDVSTNAVGVEFQILNASGNVVLLARYGLPLPSLGNFDYKTNAGFGTNASILVLPGSTPVPLTNGWWYLAVSNASGGLVDYTILASELVASTNPPPVLSTNLPNVTLDELTTLTVTNTATDANTNLTLTYTVTMSIDTSAMIINGWPLTYVTTNPPPVISANGIITWTPSEAQGPGIYVITTIVTDNSLPPLSATNSFTVTVNEVNTPPFWPANVPSQTNYSIAAGTTLVVTNTATDSDIPPNPLTYQLIGPLGAAIDTNGIITWTPTPAQAPGLYTFTTVVTDTNAYALINQSLSATNVFTVNVLSVAAPFAFTQPATVVTGTSAQLNGMATPNGLPATAWFEWGTNTLYGNQTVPVSVGASFNVVYTTNQIGGLVMNVPYHFRLVASNAVGVVYGFDQILDEANAVVWGADYAGQANVPSGLSNVVAIAGAYDHSLALKNNGTAAGWGDNTFNQATVPAGLNNLVAVAGGEYYGMALKNSGTVAAWGANILGQTNVPAGLNNVVTIAGGTFSSLALKNNGAVVAWGASFFGLTNVPASLSNAVAIAGGSYHNLAIKNDGTVMAWGDNSAGQTNVPAGLSNVVAIAGGSYHSLALKYDGTVVAWGDNSAGQTSVPVGLNNVVAVAGGGFHSLALKNDGTVVAWGDNTAGQTSVPVGLSNVVAIASGYLHSLALTPYFNVNPTNPVVLNITNGVAQTNSILAGGITYYQVNVPTNADFATNSLLFTLNGPLNIWFSTNTPPATNVFLFGGTNGSYTLSTAGAPPLAPGSTYYLGVQNTNGFAVNYGIEVDFHLTFGSIAGLTITATNIGGTNGFLLQWQGPTNFQYEIQWTTNLAPVVWNTVLNPVINVIVTTTNGHFSFFDDGTLTGGPALMKFYRVLGGLNLGPIIGPGPATNTVLAGAMSQAVVTVPANAISASNLLISATGPLSVWFNQTNPPTGNTNAGDFLMLSATNAGAFVLTSNSPPPLVPGANYYLGIQNPGASNVTFVFQVAFGFAPTNAVSGFSLTATNGGIWLRWNGLTNYQYQVQWTTNLQPPVAWNTVSNVVLTSTTGIFTFFDDGSLTGGFGRMKFYRLIVYPYMTPIPQTLSISSVTVTNIAGTNDLVFQWSAPTNYHYGIQWTTNVSLPFSNWFVIPSPLLTLTNGVYTFVDNGQTGQPASAKFFRLLEYP